jgi:hypothetical protein
MQDFPVIKRNGFFKGNDFPWLCSRLFGSQVEEGRQFGGACFIDWPLGSCAWRVFDVSLAHFQAIPSQQPLPIANMADILTQLQDAVDQVCASSNRSEVC